MGVDPTIYQGTGKMMDVARSMQLSGKAVLQQERRRMLINRQMYLGNSYLQVTGSTVRTLAPGGMLRSGRRRDRINRLRQFVDGRVAMLSTEMPPYEVVPDDMDQDTVSSTKLAEKLVHAEWENRDGWNIDEFRRRICLMGEQDGVAFSNVRFDPAAGPVGGTKVAFAPDATGRPQPVTDRSQLEALRLQDPNAESLWREEYQNLGQVKVRAVRAGRLSIDPLVTNDWSRCRWVIEADTWSVSYLEKIAGKTLKELRTQSMQNLGRRAPDAAAAGSSAVQVDDGASERTIAPGNSIVVYEAFIAAQGKNGDWPKGGHLIWADGAHGDPIVAEAWDRGIPYYPYTPKPDALEILRSRGSVDELAPIQVAFNRTLSAIGEWLDKLARPPLVIDGGSLKSNRPIWNEQGLVEVNPGMSPPRFMTVPGEPVAILNGYLQFLIEQMAEIAVQHDTTRGTAPQGPTAGVALDVLDRNNERQLAGAEAELKNVLEWTVSEALDLTEKFYTEPRLVNAPGVDNADEFQSFTGDKIRGCTRFRITGSILPRSRDSQIQSLLAVAQQSMGKVDITRYIPELMHGDADAITQRLEEDTERQHRETRQILALGRHPDRDELWGAFQTMRDTYLQAVQLAQAQGEDPAVLAQAGINPPTVAGILRTAAQAQKQQAPPMQVPGMPESFNQQPPAPLPKFPVVEDSDDDAAHIREVDSTVKGDGWDSFHELVQQGFREHRQDHLTKMHRTMTALTSLVGPSNPGFGAPGNTPGSESPQGAPPSQQPAQNGQVQKLQGVGP